MDGSFDRRVVLVDLPVRLWDRARQHADALVREFALLPVEAGGVNDLAARLAVIAAESETEYAHLNPAAEDQVESALRRGDERVTVEVHVPEAFRQHILASVPVLMEVDEYCRSGALLSLETPDELRAYWFWYLGEFVRQIDGADPTAWPG